MYEILLDKYWGSIDTRKEGFSFCFTSRISCFSGPGMSFSFYFFFFFLARLYSNDGSESLKKLSGVSH